MDNRTKEPTLYGRVKWPEFNGLYDGEPCVCTDACIEPCKGECGCEACHNAYSDFLSSRHD